MEDSKECVIDGLLSRTMIGMRGEAMMLNNSSRLPSRRPSCRPFALVLVRREGKSGERSELVHQIEASVNQSPTRRRHRASQHRRVGSLSLRVTLRKNLMQYFRYFSAAVNKLTSLDTLLANPTQTSRSHPVAVIRHVKLCDKHPDRDSEVSKNSRNVSITSA
jgi:hypothetical protein